LGLQSREVIEKPILTIDAREKCRRGAEKLLVEASLATVFTRSEPLDYVI
jgi:hypothetical protein